VIARFRFSDVVRPGAKEEISALQRRGFATYILSGDRREKVAVMADALGFAPETAFSGVTPTEKAAWIKRLDCRDTLMLGDGANDSLAFDAALVCGTPVIHRGVLEGKSDFYYLGGNLAGLQELFNVAAVRRRTQRLLLIFSIAYNALAVGLAATGRMNPLLAAILMPASSIATVVIVRIGMREAALKNQSQSE
jgi:Cu2+-exporting ATPase